MSKVSVVTVVKNDSDGLKETIRSLLLQTLSDWECLIISAPSDDDTQMVADSFVKSDNRVSHYHESHPGIYNSMNQGVNLARAPFVIFMNAGDTFKSPRSAETLFLEIQLQNTSLVVGGYSIGKRSYTYKRKSFGIKCFSINRRWGCHQSMIFSRDDIILVGGFSLDYKIASDFDLVMKILSKRKGRRISEIVSVIEPNGISSTQIRKVLTEKQEIRRKHFGKYSLSALLGEVWTLLVLSKINLRLLIGNLR